MQIKTCLAEIAKQNNLAVDTMQFPDCEIDPTKIKVIMINEVVPRNPDDWFYSGTDDPENLRNALGVFEGAGVSVKSMQDILDLGIYITAALKTPPLIPKSSKCNFRYWKLNLRCSPILSSLCLWVT